MKAVLLFGNIVLTLAMTLAIALATLWGAMALWSRLPFGATGRATIAFVFVAVMLAAALLLWHRQRLVSAGVVLASWSALLFWWSTILPSNSRDWRPDVAHVADTRIDGDVLTVDNVRNFTWRSDSDFDQHWETRTYRFSQLEGADLFLSYWAGENIAHAIVSFNFKDSLPLAFSVEIRREKGEAYSTIAGLFKTYELAVIAADERDVVKVRSTVRGEDVRLFRLDIERATALALLKQYTLLAQDASRQPRWYNTLAQNCTTVIFGMARRLDPRVRMDWRILLPGRLPAYLREHDFVSRALPLDALVAAARIATRAPGPAPDAGFSQRIRKGVPYPAGAVADKPVSK